jgi:hypothetical protein
MTAGKKLRDYSRQGKTMSEYIKPEPIKCETPFLMCIHPSKRGNVIQMLADFQKKFYHTNLDINLLEKPHPLEIPVHEPENIQKFMASNSDIKVRMK